MKVGFIGLGLMGSGIAANILKAGHDLIVYNRSAAKTEPLVRDGAKAATTPREAAAGREIVLSMLADDAALEAVLEGDDGLLAGLAPGALHVSLSTIAVATAESVAARHAAKGQAYVSAPVFGRPDAAAAARISVVAAGPAAEIAKAKPLFEAIGQKLFEVGETASHANVIKLCGNFSLLAVIETLGEAMTLAEKSGVPREKLLEVMTGTLFDALAYRTYGAIIVQERFRPAGFTAPLGLKDMRLVGQAAEKTVTPMPLLSLLRDRLTETIAKEGPDIDWSGIALTNSKNAGL